ncbi:MULTISPECIES: MerR family transcriptional regulator [Bacillus]|uniref:MerR family transcriptional regulator n=2 Tax=Bacillus TaxID=1386 RepID=A0A0M5JCC5_9BACI|nr:MULTISPECIES: MerR family transcriptional regulator [Bacillus]ALC83044.1 MerR family transcriptional regulator [Bacillus gobiensis]MBP1082079.1 DNA-binding transcriptional MerR regulator [Bacillus capparidis]MED1096704.1 MerR family transcriptional regulator [Bacillus capparidis]
MVIESKKYWKVGELAKLTGLTIRTLRYYDQIGLFSPSVYSDSGYRLYDESDISRLQQILTLKDLGLSLEEIKSILSDDNYNPFDVVSLQIARLKENIRIQQKLLKELQNVSSLMQNHEPPTVEDFTNLLGMMKKSHERYFAERKMNMEYQFDRLGNFLAKHPNEPN